MSNSGGKITGNVTISDIKAVLGTSENSLKNLCRHSSINIWAKYKPVKLNDRNTRSQLDENSGKWKSDANWFHGTTGAFGLRPYSSSVFSDIISNTTGGMNGWVYERPEGNSTYPCRQIDFMQYNHLAPPALFAFICTAKTAQGKSFTGTCGQSPGGGDEVSLEDLQVPKYFGVALVNSNNGVVCHGTNASPGISTVIWNSMPGLTYGTYTAVPFLCSDAIEFSIGSFASQHTFYTCPNIATAQVEVTSPTGVHDITFAGEWYTSAKNGFWVDITNDEGTTYTAKLYIMRSGRSWDQYGDHSYPDESVQDLELTKNSTIRAYGLTDGSTYNHNVFLRLNSDGAVFRVALLEPIDPPI